MSTGFKLIVLFLLISVSALAEPTDTLKSTASRKELIVKLEREFIGATVEIVSPDGRVIAVDSLQRKKIVIDFANVLAGNYLVRFTKGSRKHELRYLSN